MSRKKAKKRDPFGESDTPVLCFRVVKSYYYPQHLFCGDGGSGAGFLGCPEVVEHYFTFLLNYHGIDFCTLQS